MNVLGLISSINDPASYVRIIQYQRYFKADGLTLTPKYFKPLKDQDPGRLANVLHKFTGINPWRLSDLNKVVSRIPLMFITRHYDIIWQNRLLQIKNNFWEDKLKKPVVFDFDDAIWINEGSRQVGEKIKNSAFIFAGNDYLAEYASKYNRNVVVIPSAIDIHRLYPIVKHSDIFKVGWIGTPSNFKYLDIVKDALTIFLRDNSAVKLIIVSSEKPPQFEFDDKKVIFKYWNRELENEIINEFSVGIMPLINDDWCRGKCSYKMLQYMACGKPVIVSPVGTNQVIINQSDVGFTANTTSEWVKKLMELQTDQPLSKSLGENGRSLVIKKYSCDTIAPKIIDIFKNIYR